MSDAPDHDLLGRYARAHDQTAFAGLVQRHGPLVLGVCQRALGPGQDADDAVQAVFLVLARHAGRLGPGDLAPWLHRVAQRCARRLARQRARRRDREQAVSRPPDTVAPEAVAPADLAPLLPHLDAALAGLPGRERDLLVLCFLQGRSQRAAAAALAIPDGSAARLIAQGLARLRVALQRRGVPAAALSALALPGTPPGIAPALPEGLARSIAGQATGGTPSAAVLAAASGAPTLPAIAALVCAGLLALGAAIVAWPASSPPRVPAATAMPPPEPQPPPVAWPADGIALGQEIDSGFLRWNPQGTELMLRGADGYLLLAAPSGLRRLDALGAFRYLEGDWLADGRWLQPGRSSTYNPQDGSTGELERGVWTTTMLVDATGVHAVLPPPSVPGHDLLVLSSDRRQALVQRRTAGNRLVAVWVFTVGDREARPVALPEVAGQHLIGMQWEAAGALEAHLRPVGAKNGAGWWKDVIRRRSHDGGATWIPLEGEWWHQPYRGPYPLGALGAMDLADATRWILPDGGSLSVEPGLPDSARQVAELAVPAASGVIITTADGSTRRVPWPIADGDRPWPVALLPDGSVLVARHRRMHWHASAPWSPMIESWAFLAPTGDLTPIALPSTRPDPPVHRLDISTLIVGGDRSVLVHHLYEPETLLLARVGQPIGDLATGLGLPAGWAADVATVRDRTQRSVVAGALALCVRPQQYIRGPGPRRLLVWSGSTAPILLHHSQGIADAVTAFVWDGSGRRLAWVQGGRLRVWTAGDPGLALPSAGATTDF